MNSAGTLAKRPEESDFDYHRRLVLGKMVDKTLDDTDYAELSELVYGKPYSSDITRKMMYGSRATIDMIDREAHRQVTADTVADELSSRMIELQKERQRFFDQRSAYNKIVREQARQDELIDMVARSIQEGNLPALCPSDEHEFAYEVGTRGELIVTLADLHYGAQVHSRWNRYDSDICARRMAAYLRRTLQIGDANKCSACTVVALGDMISGSIHHSIQVSNRENTIQQITGVSELIAQFLSELSRRFERVRYVSVSGNHSRIDTKDRALMQERLDDLVEWYLAARLSAFENVEICSENRIDSSMSVVDVAGKTYIAVHGDYDPSPSHIQALQTMVGAPVYAVLLGHKHHNATDNVQGIRTVMAGSMMGMDDYCIQKRLYGTPEQMVCVCDENGIVCQYPVDLSGIQ